MRPQAGKDKILDAALDLFATRGFHRTSVDQIAAKAGVSKGLTYNYFDRKEDLLIALVERASEAMVSVAGVHAGSATGYQIMLRDLLARFGRMLKQNHEGLSFQLSLLFDPALQDLLRPLLRKRSEGLLAASKDLFHTAGVADPEMTARRFVSELDGIALHYLRVFEDYPLDDMLIGLYENYKDIGK